MKSWNDSRVRGRMNGYGGRTPYSETFDPPRLVPCPHCLETVIAAHHLYFDNPGEAHRHKPHLGDACNSQFHPKRDPLPPELE